ncbi:MAG: DUF1573 domain-containing protein [Bacteroidia bacterium]|nr:DUF1573 domain-containing protein [Bacteroidia bacterium]
MKTSFFFLLFVSTLAVSAQTMFHAEPTMTLEVEGSVVSVSFDEKEFDLGKIPQGIPVSHTFTFTNTGNADLRIESVQASCGCTATNYTKEPIAPGETGYITATYNAAGAGIFTKTVTVKSNAAEPNTVLRIKGEVSPQKE